MKKRNFIGLDLLKTNSTVSDNGCWNWVGDKSQRYPRVHIDGKYRKVHHIACLLKHGEPPASSEVVMHECDNTRCCNPDHVRYGTHSENTIDSVIKGRFGGFKNRGKKRSEEFRAHLSKIKTGLKHSDETRKKLSAASLGKKKTELHGINISKGLSGLKKTEAHCLSMSKARKGVPGKKGRVVSDITRQKISATLRRYNANV